MSYLEKLLAESKKKREAATPGPWEFERISHDSGEFSYEMNMQVCFIALYERNYFKAMHAKFDSDFIAHARNTTEAKDEIIAVLAEALKIAAHRHHIDCDKVCVGCCPIYIKNESLQKAESLAKEALEK